MVEEGGGQRFQLGFQLDSLHETQSDSDGRLKLQLPSGRERERELSLSPHITSDTRGSGCRQGGGVRRAALAGVCCVIYDALVPDDGFRPGDDLIETLAARGRLSKLIYRLARELSLEHTDACCTNSDRATE